MYKEANNPIKNLVTSESSNNSFFCEEEVKKCKNQILKNRCEDAITSCGISNQDFYERVNISRQQWYYWSWGLIEFPLWLKVKLCDEFGKPFRDLFLMEDKQ